MLFFLGLPIIWSSKSCSLKWWGKKDIFFLNIFFINHKNQLFNEIWIIQKNNFFIFARTGKYLKIFQIIFQIKTLQTVGHSFCISLLGQKLFLKSSSRQKLIGFISQGYLSYLYQDDVRIIFCVVFCKVNHLHQNPHVYTKLKQKLKTFVKNFFGLLRLHESCELSACVDFHNGGYSSACNLIRMVFFVDQQRFFGMLPEYQKLFLRSLHKA